MNVEGYHPYIHRFVHWTWFIHSAYRTHIHVHTIIHTYIMSTGMLFQICMSWVNFSAHLGHSGGRFVCDWNATVTRQQGNDILPSSSSALVWIQKWTTEYGLQMRRMAFDNDFHLELFLPYFLWLWCHLLYITLRRWSLSLIVQYCLFDESCFHV